MTNVEVPKKKRYAGKMSSMYYQQFSSSKNRKMRPPNYSLKKFSEWLEENGFRTLYDSWVAGGLKKGEAPSADRVNPTLPYTIDNLELITWAENERRGTEYRKVDPRFCKEIAQYKDEECISKYHSIAHASRISKVGRTNIVNNLTGKSKSAGGFIWKYNTTTRSDVSPIQNREV